MKQICFYLDFISPHANLAFEELPQALMGLSYSVTYKPLLLAALLKHHGQLGPAEHPFNPLGLLHLALAADARGQPNRYVCETLFKHAWLGGADADDATRLAAITQQLAPLRDPTADAVKAQLRTHTEEAISLGVFDVPSFVVDGKVFWGLDALPMLREYLNSCSLP